MSNLPNFPGAAVVYRRAEAILQALNSDEYKRQLAANKGRKLKSYRPPAESDAIVDAMNKGNEEALKAATHEYRHLINL